MHGERKAGDVRGGKRTREKKRSRGWYGKESVKKDGKRRKSSGKETSE